MANCQECKVSTQAVLRTKSKARRCSAAGSKYSKCSDQAEAQPPKSQEPKATWLFKVAQRAKAARIVPCARPQPPQPQVMCRVTRPLPHDMSASKLLRLLAPTEEAASSEQATASSQEPAKDIERFSCLISVLLEVPVLPAESTPSAGSRGSQQGVSCCPGLWNHRVGS